MSTIHTADKFECCYLQDTEEIIWYLEGCSSHEFLMMALSLLDKDDRLDFEKIGGRDNNCTYQEHEAIFIPEEIMPNEMETLRLIRMAKTAEEWISTLQQSTLTSISSYFFNSNKGITVGNYAAQRMNDCCIRIPVSLEQEFLKRLEEQYPVVHDYVAIAMKQPNSYFVLRDRKPKVILPDVNDLYIFIKNEIYERIQDLF